MNSKFDENSMSDCDIVYETPEKQSKQKISRKPKSYKHSDPNELIHLAQGSSQIVKLLNEDRIDSEISDNTPYVYKQLEVVASYDNNNFPVNNNLHVIGTVSHNNNQHCLYSFNNPNTMVPVIFTQTIPKIEDIIIAYGQLNLMSNEHSFKPVITVKFWKNISRNESDKLMALQEKIKMFIPEYCTRLKSFSLDMSSFSGNDTLRYESDSIFIQNETLINKICDQ